MATRPVLCLCGRMPRICELAKRMDLSLVSRVVTSMCEPEQELAELKLSGEPIVLCVIDAFGMRAMRFLCDDVAKPLSERRVKWVHSFRIGIDVFNMNELMEVLGDTPFTISKGDCAPYLAAHVLYSALYFCRQTVKLQRDRAMRRWDTAPTDSILGCTVLIFGYGDIGREVARVFRPLHVNLVGVKRSAGSSGTDSNNGSPMSMNSPLLYVDDHDVRIVCDRDDVQAALREADYIVNILPATSRTVRMFDKTMFAKMKPSAVYINIGRGSTQNEDDLAQALRDGALRGASLDVFEVEPLPPTSPLWDLDDDKLLMTPHTAFMTESGNKITVDAFIANMETYVKTGCVKGYRPNLHEGY